MAGILRGIRISCPRRPKIDFWAYVKPFSGVSRASGCHAIHGLVYLYMHLDHRDAGCGSGSNITCSGKVQDVAVNKDT